MEGGGWQSFTVLPLRGGIKVWCSQVTCQCSKRAVSGLRVRLGSLGFFSSLGAGPHTECQSTRGGPKRQLSREEDLLLFTSQLGNVFNLFLQLVSQFLIGNPVTKHTREA